MIALAMVLSAVGFATPLAQAVTLPGTPQLDTRMEIDASPNANKTTDVAGNFDWIDILDSTLPGPYVGTGFTSAGIVDASYVIDSPGTIAGACVSDDATAFPDNTTIHTNPWNIGPVSNPVKKGDLCTGAAALEVINVGGDIHYILYQYWTRDPSSTGDVSMFQILEGPQPGRCDDRLLESNYNPSGNPSTTFAVYSWLPTAGAGNCTDPNGSGTWQPTSIAGVQTVGANPDKGVAANDDTFGESAIDLTANGIIPSDRCVTFTTSGFISRTGNSNASQNIDSLTFNDPIVFNNCAPVSISKVTQPADFNSSDTFTYKLDQLAGAVHDSTLLPSLDSDGSFASITDTIQSGQTDTWSNVIAQSDYRLAETVLPTMVAAADLVYLLGSVLRGQRSSGSTAAHRHVCHQSVEPLRHPAVDHQACQRARHGLHHHQRHLGHPAGQGRLRRPHPDLQLHDDGQDRACAEVGRRSRLRLHARLSHRAAFTSTGGQPGTDASSWRLAIRSSD